MRDSVKAAFRAFSEHFEGSLPFMYLDGEGLVTTGIGNLIDPVSSALALPWTHKADGSAATSDQIAAEWIRVKALQAWKGYGGKYFGDGASLVLTDGGLTCLLLDKLAQNEVYLKKRFHLWDTWPADAQMATLSCAWASGPAWVAPRFDLAANAQHWASCAVECHMGDASNPGLRPRNVANASLFLAAAKSTDPEVLDWPS